MLLLKETEHCQERDYSGLVYTGDEPTEREGVAWRRDLE